MFKASYLQTQATEVRLERRRPRGQVDPSHYKSRLARTNVRERESRALGRSIVGEPQSRFAGRPNPTIGRKSFRRAPRRISLWTLELTRVLIEGTKKSRKNT